MESNVRQKSDGKQGLVVTKRESKSIVSYSASKQSRTAKTEDGFGSGIHSSGYSK